MCTERERGVVRREIKTDGEEKRVEQERRRGGEEEESGRRRVNRGS